MVAYNAALQPGFDAGVPRLIVRAAIYIRKSDKTESRSKSLEEQLSACRKICEHQGFTVEEVRIYHEEEGNKGTWWWDDGYHPGPYRPELTRMMQDIEAGLIDVVVVWRSDRLYRDAGICDAIMKIFRAKGIRFQAGARDLDIESASGLFAAAMEAANNRRYRDMISEDIRRDHLFKAQLGMFSRDPSCVGFRSRGKGTQEVEPIAEDLALVNRIFRLFVLGEGDRGPLGTNGIANLLMDEGVVWPKGRKGHKPKNPEKIHDSNIKTVLTNCMYVARWRHDGKEYECEKVLIPVLDSDGKPTGKHETAVPIALYEAAQEKLARADRPGKRSLGATHLLTGLAVCARCGRPLIVHYTAYKVEKGKHTGEPRPPRANFICNHKRGTKPCPPGSILRLQEGVLDAWMLSHLASLLHCQISQMRAESGREADVHTLAELERQLREARARETKKLSALVSVMDAEQFGAVAAQLRAEREALDRRINEVRSRIGDSEQRLPDLSPSVLSQMSKAALKEAFSRALQWIAIGKQGIVVLTTWGTYIGAAYRPRDRNNPDEINKVIYLAAPEPAFTLECLDVLTDKEAFIWGRRHSLGRKADRLSDAELLPGLVDESEEQEEYILEGEAIAFSEEEETEQ